MTRVTYEVQVLLDMTCGSRQRFHRHVVTPLQVTSPFLGLFLRTQSNGLSIGVGICGVCQSSSPGFRRSHTLYFHRLLPEVAEVEFCLEFRSELRVQVGIRGKLDGLRGDGRRDVE